MTLRQLQARIPLMAFNQAIGMRVMRRHKDGVTIECPLRPDLLNGAGVLHGGVTATMADAAVGIALWAHFDGKRPATTIELKINYFLPVASGRIIARSHLIRVGKSICVGRVDLFDSHKRLVGEALVTYMLL